LLIKNSLNTLGFGIFDLKFLWWIFYYRLACYCYCYCYGYSNGNSYC